MKQHDLAAIARGIAPVLRELAAKDRGPAGAQGVAGVRGQGGPVGPPGRDGRDGLPGDKGEKGVDGLHGRAGADGLGFDDLTVTHDGARAFTFRFIQGDRIREFTCSLPVLIYRGVYVDAGAYEKGDVVTWGGSLWHCHATTTTGKPGGSESRDWVLAVKHGRDGKAGPVGVKGLDGKDGAAGRDLTQLGPDGRRW